LKNNKKENQSNNNFFCCCSYYQISSIQKAEKAKKKREKKKLARKKAKINERLRLNMIHPDDQIDVAEDLSLFSLKSLRGSGVLILFFFHFSFFLISFLFYTRI